jgi:ribose transport system permease protein
MSNTAQSVARPPLGRRIRRFMSDRPIVPLIVLLIMLVLILQLLRPGIINERWIANTTKFAIPLAILASCQTLTMLTGGIDLSVGTVATMSAFIVASQVGLHHPAVAMLISLIPAVLIGVANGIGVGVFRVHPLIMTLGTSLIGTGFLQVYQRTVIAAGSEVPTSLAWLGTGLHGIGGARSSCRLPSGHVYAAQDRLRPAAHASVTTNARRALPACSAAVILAL